MEVEIDSKFDWHIDDLSWTLIGEDKAPFCELVLSRMHWVVNANMDNSGMNQLEIDTALVFNKVCSFLPLPPLPPLSFLSFLNNSNFPLLNKKAHGASFR